MHFSLLLYSNNTMLSVCSLFETKNSLKWHRSWLAICYLPSTIWFCRWNAAASWIILSNSIWLSSTPHSISASIELLLLLLNRQNVQSCKMVVIHIVGWNKSSYGNNMLLWDAFVAFAWWIENESNNNNGTAIIVAAVTATGKNSQNTVMDVYQNEFFTVIDRQIDMTVGKMLDIRLAVCMKLSFAKNEVIVWII